MSLDDVQFKFSSRASAFMQTCAERVFAMGDDQPTLTYDTRSGGVKVYACAESRHLSGYFRSILHQDAKRFYRLSRAFERAQPALGAGGQGWALTRFSGQGYLSLRLADEIFVFKVPPQLRDELIAGAVAQHCYLDCSVVTSNAAAAQNRMPLQLAVELAG